MKDNRRVKRVNDLKVKQIIVKKYSSYNQSLSLDYCPDDWAETLRNKDWSMLRELLLRNCMIEDQDIRIIRQSSWPFLDTIRLHDNRLTIVGLKKLFKDIDFTNLIDLCLGSNNIGLAGVKLLIKLNLPKIKQLCLGMSQIGDEGSKLLVKGRWPELQSLRIASNKIGIYGFAQFHTNNWRAMTQIQVQENIDNSISIFPLVCAQSKKLNVQRSIISKIFDHEMQNIFDARCQYTEEKQL